MINNKDIGSWERKIIENDNFGLFPISINGTIIEQQSVHILQEWSEKNAFRT